MSAHDAECLLEPGTLWNRIVERTARASHCGALHTISTAAETIEDSGVPFLVRYARNLEQRSARKSKPRGVGARNPFLPYDNDLFVGNVSPTHVCLLNKFNVVGHHILIVTRSFEDQTSPLARRDFEAMWCCMDEFDALAFYNAGQTAGASQPHRHLQLVPVPLTPGAERMPIDSLLGVADLAPGAIGTAPGLPFAHALARSDDIFALRPRQAAGTTMELYSEMLQRLGLGAGAAPYNLLVTRRWLLMVPRHRQTFESIEINALGFAGTLFARCREQLERIRELGPLTILANVVSAE